MTTPQERIRELKEDIKSTTLKVVYEYRCAVLSATISCYKDELEFLISIDYHGLAIDNERGQDGVNIAFQINKRIQQLKEAIQLGEEKE